MSAFNWNSKNTGQLKDKVVVLTGNNKTSKLNSVCSSQYTGGANGIGAEAVKLFSQNGAKVVFGDIDATTGSTLAGSLNSPDVHFLPLDVTNYASILALFQKAFELYARVDICVSNAGIVERPGWFEPSHDLTSIQTAPSTAVLDINLTGTLYFARIAAVYLRQNAIQGMDKSLVLLSSVAGFEESPGLFVYQATKHGVIGLMRSLRKYLPNAYKETSIRVNCICPWATKTAMTETFSAQWEEAQLPMNSALDVAQTIVGVASDTTVDGESVYVEGGNSWLFEENLRRLQPQWLGQSAYDNLMKGQAFLGAVSTCASFYSRSICS